MLFRRFACVLAIPVSVTTAAHAQRLASLDLLKKGYPRAFFFRQSESMAASGQMSYEEWEKQMLPLNGIMGKALAEEVPGHDKARPFFVRYKAAHPEKAVLLHLNGNGRDPRFESEEFFAGHWLYYNGCKLTRDLEADAKQTLIHVEDTSLFKVNMGLNNNSNEELGICMFGVDGKLDWSRSEQVELMSIDAKKKTLTVKRGSFGTKPLRFPAGQSYIAAHVTRGPWGAKSNLIWLYNYSTVCPKDAKGRTCNDVALEHLRRWFTDGGILSTFDGLEFDASPYSKGPEAPRERDIDVDADGKADNGYINGVNVFGIGSFEYHRRLREMLGEDWLIMADDNGKGSQRSYGVLNGIESEGWPDLKDRDLVDWSEGINRHLFWRDNARQPAFSYINLKYSAREGQSGKAPFSICRLVMAAAMMTDSGLTYSMKPPQKEGEPSAIWDELIMGDERKANWLGAPRGGTIRLGMNAPDLLEGAGAPPTPPFASRWISADAAVSLDASSKALKIEPKPSASRGARLTYSGLRIPKGDLLIHARLWAEPMKDYPTSIPRLVYLGCGASGRLITPELPRTGVCVRGKAEGPLDSDNTNAQFQYADNTVIGEERHVAYSLHPPMVHAQGPGYVFWERDVAVPPAPCALTFFTGLEALKNNSDGVLYSVVVKTDGKQGKVFEFLHAANGWKGHSVDLAAWAGRAVTLKFIADSGPKDDSTADHGFWGDVVLGAPGAGPAYTQSRYTPGRVLTHAGTKPFLAEFYFRDAGPATVDLTLEVEGSEPIYLSDFTVHSAPDAMAREFDNGAVLANPSMRDFTFDLKALFPGMKLRRLKGTPSQDPKTNNGQAVGDAVTLGPRDALFLVSQDSTK